MKNQLNDKKGQLIKGKSTKIAAAFMQNKPNFSFAIINISSFVTGKYQNKTAFRQGKNKPNQTQYKANSNTIPERPKMNLNVYFTSEYKKLSYWCVTETNPNKPNNLVGDSDHADILRISSKGLHPLTLQKRVVIGNDLKRAGSEALLTLKMALLTRLLTFRLSKL